MAGLTTNITPNSPTISTTAFLRNYWPWDGLEIRRRRPGLGGALEIVRGEIGNCRSRALQCEHAANAHPFLGWARSNASRRCFHAEGQPSLQVWRHLRAQLGLAPAHRQRRRHQLSGGLRTGNGTVRIRVCIKISRRAAAGGQHPTIAALLARQPWALFPSRRLPIPAPAQSDA